jgi:Uma2 family endonuclease
VRLPEADEPDAVIQNVVQPDVAVICDPAKLDDAGCRGAPDWIIEVLSPSTAAKDQTDKLRLYERHGVREYWLVHPTDRVLTVYRLQVGAYGRPLIQPLAGETDCAAVPGLRIRWPAPEGEPAALPSPGGEP